MFEQVFTALSNPTAQNAIGYTQQMMECTLKLTKAQMEVMQGLCDEVSQEYREAMTSGDPSALQKNWSGLMSAAVRANTEAAVLLMKNAKEFQGEVFQMIPISPPALFGQITKDMMETVKTNGSTRPAARAKKAV